MGKYIYRFYKEKDLAENWRDTRNIETEDIKYFKSLKEAKDFIINYLRKEMNYIVDTCNFSKEYREQRHKETEEKLPKTIKFNKDNLWMFSELGSWAVFYYLKRILL